MTELRIRSPCASDEVDGVLKSVAGVRRLAIQGVELYLPVLGLPSYSREDHFIYFDPEEITHPLPLPSRTGEPRAQQARAGGQQRAWRCTMERLE